MAVAVLRKSRRDRPGPWDMITAAEQEAPFWTYKSFSCKQIVRWDRPSS
jgi:hypothetical protein